jgi:hypothetical protein
MQRIALANLPAKPAQSWNAQLSHKFGVAL